MALPISNYTYRATPSGGLAPTTSSPAGNVWSASSLSGSSVGPLNESAQQPISATSLFSTPSDLVDRSLGSRRYVNPNTGIRDPVLSGSVYANPNVPAFLAQSVSDLNAEQTMRRSLQAELIDRLVRGASGGNVLLAEALRSAVISPGASAGFGSAIEDPRETQARAAQARSASQLTDTRRSTIQDSQQTQQQIADIQRRLAVRGTSDSGIFFQSSPTAALQSQLNTLRRQQTQQNTTASNAFSVGGAARLPTNSFQIGYNPIY